MVWPTVSYSCRYQDDIVLSVCRGCVAETLAHAVGACPQAHAAESRPAQEVIEELTERVGRNRTGNFYEEWGNAGMLLRHLWVDAAVMSSACMTRSPALVCVVSSSEAQLPIRYNENSEGTSSDDCCVDCWSQYSMLWTHTRAASPASAAWSSEHKCHGASPFLPLAVLCSKSALRSKAVDGWQHSKMLVLTCQGGGGCPLPGIRST